MIIPWENCISWRRNVGRVMNSIFGRQANAYNWFSRQINGGQRTCRGFHTFASCDKLSLPRWKLGEWLVATLNSKLERQSLDGIIRVPAFNTSLCAAAFMRVSSKGLLFFFPPLKRSLQLPQTQFWFVILIYSFLFQTSIENETLIWHSQASKEISLLTFSS